MQEFKTEMYYIYNFQITIRATSTSKFPPTNTKIKGFGYPHRFDQSLNPHKLAKKNRKIPEISCRSQSSGVFSRDLGPLGWAVGSVQNQGANHCDAKDLFSRSHLQPMVVPYLAVCLEETNNNKEPTNIQQPPRRQRQKDLDSGDI